MPMPSSDTPLSANVRYGFEQFGWSFTPLRGKKAYLKGWPERPRETLDEALSWCRQGNVGLRTGRASGVVVIDADPGSDVSPLNLPATVSVVTGRGGRHYYFRCGEPVGNAGGRKLGEHIDIRGDGGQVVFPGSVHPETGRRYEWADGGEPWTVEIADLPEAILERLRADDAPPKPKKASVPTRHPASSDGASEQKYALSALDQECKAVALTPEGERNNRLNTAAFNLGQLVGGGYLSREEVERQLDAAARAAGLKSSEAAPTIRSGLDAGMKEPREVEPARKPSRQATATRHKPRTDYVLTPGPHVTDTGEYLEQSNATFANDVLEAMPPDTLYRRDTIPGELIGDPGRLRWTEITENAMAVTVDEHVKLGKWVTRKKDDEAVMVYQPCSRQQAGLVIATARKASSVRDLRLVVSYPVYGPGWVRVRPGWQEGIYFDEPFDLEDLRPEPDMEVIHNTLYDLVVDFPFASKADMENFFGLLLTPIVATALEGNRPMHLVHASLERTGKSKLVNEVFGGVILGRDTPSMQITEREEEREKRILAMLLQDDTLVHLDNLPAWIDSPALSSLLTAHTFSGRMLGVTRNLKLPNNLTLVGTGNNVQATGEVSKRMVPIRLQPRTPNPEERRDFHHPDLRGYVRQRRRDVLETLLGLIENWLKGGRPMCPNRLGGFESWSAAIGGILGMNGFTHWRTNESAWRALSNPQGEETAAFVALWWERYGDAQVSPTTLLEMAESEGLFEHITSRKGAGVSFGRMLQRHTDTPVLDWVVRYERRNNRPCYRLEKQGA